MDAIRKQLNELHLSGNLRVLPGDCSQGDCIDFTSNDYLGISTRMDLRKEFFRSVDVEDFQMSASASRLLTLNQKPFCDFEDTLSYAYGRPALLFNSGYHANSGLVAAFASKVYVVIADKFVHASIIDGIKLSGCGFERFRHNDMRHARLLADKVSSLGKKPLFVVESVYSMDGDYAPLEELVDVKHRYPGALLYVDEAHAIGVEGSQGLGLSKDLGRRYEDVDIIVGTMGKALGSVGAFAIMDESLKLWAINKARSFIFSTALPPYNIMWSKFIFEKALAMDDERRHLKALGRRLGDGLGTQSVGHIQPIIIGDPHKAVEMARSLKDGGLNVMPIRTPTVPPGTDRLRISLSASLSHNDIDKLLKALKDHGE